MTVFVFPGDPETLTGGFAYDRDLLGALEARGRQVGRLVLPDGFPALDPATAAEAAARLDAIPDGEIVIVDGLAAGVLPEALERLSRRATLVVLVHHPLADETGLSTDEAARLFESERAALAAARHVITSSHFTARRLADFGVAADRITVVEPGIAERPLARGSGAERPGEGPKPVALLTVASLIPRKAYSDLLLALADLPPGSWTLDCVGSTRLDPGHADAVRRQAAVFGGAVRFHGDLTPDALDSLYDRADLFVSPSRYEGYGMAIAEAAMCGLPIVAAAGGAVPMTAAGRLAELVEPGDVKGLASALHRLVTDPVARASVAERVRQGRGTLPRWQDGAAAVDRLLTRLAGN